MASPNLMVVSHLLETQQAFASILGSRGIAPILASTAEEGTNDSGPPLHLSHLLITWRCAGKGVLSDWRPVDI